MYKSTLSITEDGLGLDSDLVDLVDLDMEVFVLLFMEGLDMADSD